MKQLNELLLLWSKTNTDYVELLKQKNILEQEIYKLMKKYHWDSYKSIDDINVSILEEDTYVIDENQLSILLSKDDIEKIKQYNNETRIIIVTPDSRKKFSKLIKRGFT